jgi:hypothetical protein
MKITAIFALVAFHFEDFSTRIWPMIQSLETEKFEKIVFTGYLKHDFWKSMIEKAVPQASFCWMPENTGKAHAVNTAFVKYCNDAEYLYISDGDMRMNKDTVQHLSECWDSYAKETPFKLLGYIVVTQTGDDRVFVHEKVRQNELWIEMDTSAPAGGALLISKTMFEMVDMLKSDQLKDKQWFEDVILFQEVKSFGATVLVSKKATCHHPFQKKPPESLTPVLEESSVRKHISVQEERKVPPRSRAEIMMDRRNRK